MTLIQAIELARAREKAICCIARFLQTGEAPHVFYQVIVDPNKVTRSGKFIRFEGNGNEIFGFKPTDSMEVFEVLGEVNGEIVTPIEEEPRALHALST